MEREDDVQGFVNRMPSSLSILYHTPIEQRKAAIEPLNDDIREEIDNAIEKITEESKVNYRNTKRKIELLQSDKKGPVSLQKEYSEKIQDAINLKNKAEQNTKDFLSRAENHACSFLSSQASTQQLDLLKQSFIQYLKENYDLKSGPKRKVFQTNEERKTEQQNSSAIYESLLNRTCNILNVTKSSLLMDPAFQQVEAFSLQYSIFKSREEDELFTINLYKKNKAEKEQRIGEIENELKQLETPLYLFIHDLNLISNLL